MNLEALRVFLLARCSPRESELFIIYFFLMYFCTGIDWDIQSCFCPVLFLCIFCGKNSKVTYKEVSYQLVAKSLSILGASIPLGVCFFQGSHKSVTICPD